MPHLQLIKSKMSYVGFLVTIQHHAHLQGSVPPEYQKNTVHTWS